MNLFSLALKGGIMMLPIFLCSVLGVYVVIERYLVLRSAQINISSFLQKVKEGFRRSGVSGVEEVCSRTLAPIANILLRGIAKHSFGETKIKEAIENAGRDEIYHLEKRLNWLAIVAGIAPMLGFLGTVTGMIAAFQQIEAQGANVVPADLAGGIWEALVTTAFGLMVGIPAFAFYNYFVTRIERFVHEMEVTANEFIDLLDSENGQAKEPAPVKERKATVAVQPPDAKTTIEYQPKRRTFGDDDFFSSRGNKE